MFTPKEFELKDIPTIVNFIAKNSFGIIISQLDSKIVATHIPIEISQKENGNYFLDGHISIANEQWKSLKNDTEVLVIFNGPNHYISSSWYDHENVPTWNYMAVHVYGKIKLIEGDELYHKLNTLVDKYEAISKCPIHLDQISKEFITNSMKGIIGFEIKITEFQATAKLSQNRDEKNKANIIKELRELNKVSADDIANEMSHFKNEN
ncbi:MAG: FMN-binding negative transcriptional regulator [Flavobacteriia bacterium]|nr:FMN-binding negative transcriptional regulator [Flavobacteriia bacterium]